jgi:hypothetical protein
MSERKYRQPGYRDDDRRGAAPATVRKTPEPRDPRLPRDPRAPSLPGFRQVVRCARCGHIEGADVGATSTCGKCGVDLHACIQCDAFDPGATFECRQTIRVRVSPKDRRNDCSLFAARVQVERETGSTPPTSARKAFDDLFKR